MSNDLIDLEGLPGAEILREGCETFSQGSNRYGRYYQRLAFLDSGVWAGTFQPI